MLVGATAYAATQVADLQNGVMIMVAGLGGMYMAMNIGANDVANNVGAAVGSGALTMTGALVIAAAFLAVIKATIVYREDKIAAARTWVPVLVAVMGAAFAAYLMMKGLNKIWRPDTTTVLAISGATFATIYMMVKLMVAIAVERMRNTREDVGWLFTIPLIGATALLSFAHGSNDMANTIGPLASIVHVASNGGVVSNVSIPNWVMVIGVLGLSAGLALYGAKLVKTVGTEITEIDRLRAYPVVLSSAITVIVASTLALPVSSTHIALGAIIGVGFLREHLQYKAERVRIIREFFNDKMKPKLFDSAKAEMA